MKLFIQRVTFFCLLLLLLCGIGILIIPPNKHTTNSLLFGELKKDSLLLHTPSPRLILIGGSNLSFGINSAIIKDSLNVNPINTAIHAGIGLKFMLDHNLKYIKKGDIIVIVPEYQQYYGNLFLGEEELIRTVFDVSISDSKYLSLQQWITLFPRIISYGFNKFNLLDYTLRKHIYINTDSVYFKSSFNKFGDASAHWKLNSINPPAIDIKDKYDFNINAIKALTEFQIKAEKKGAIVFIGYPGYQTSSFNKGLVQIKQIQNELDKKSFKILGNPYRYMVPDSLCYDTQYHLIKKGVDWRTKLLIQDLKLQGVR